MTCAYMEITPEDWRGCRCGAKAAKCRAPERQHPNTPPIDPAGFHSERAADEEGNIIREYTRVNSLYCTPRACRSYTEKIE